ncbi:MAG: hypothetical protein AAGA75_20310 [Cyanobacteria bacterium P01_E01_bin.6]
MPHPAQGQTIQNIDDSPNDEFNDRAIVEPGVSRIFGQLTPADLPEPVYTTNATFNPGDVNTFTIPNLPASEPFLAWVDHDGAEIDTIMGQFDDAGEMINFDDDGSPAGALAPAIRGVVPSSGMIELQVTEFGDNDFDGTLDFVDEYCCEDCTPPDDSAEYYREVCSEENVSGSSYGTGDYTLSVLIGDVEVNGDVDFFTLSGMPPGHAFVVSESLSEVGIRMQWLARDGSVISNSSYSETNNREQIGGLVPANGEVHVVVRGYAGYGYWGNEDYLLQVETRDVGEE